MSSLDELTREIVQRHAGLVQSMRRDVSEAIAIGELLDRARAGAKHGEFLPWIERELRPQGISRRTAYRYLDMFEWRIKVASLANLHDAYKRIECLASQVRQTERERTDRLIAEKQTTGQKPAGWDRSCAREERRRQEDVAFDERLRSSAQMKHGDHGPDAAQEIPRGSGWLEDFLKSLIEAEWIKGPPQHEDLKLADMRANVAQGQVFTVLREYVESFEGVSRQLEAVHNVMVYMRRVGIELQPQTQEMD